MNGLPRQAHPDLLVGLETSDDAGVFRLNADSALVQTLDFFTPIVSDPYLFGQIAAANALSDVYAMGGRPLTAMNLLTFSPNDLAPEEAREILRGGAEKVAEAGAVIVGGHTVDDPQVKYGLSVTGIVHPDHVWTNAGACPGDALVITKAIGTGIITTAMTAGAAGAAGERAAIESMRTLNAEAARLATGEPVSAATDITGFGLLGHLAEMAMASHVDIDVRAEAVPLLPEVPALAADGFLPAGLYRNRAHFGGKVTFAPGVSLPLQDVLYDPQTSGGLVLSLPEPRARQLCRTLQLAGIPASVFASVGPGSGLITVREG